MSVTALIHRYLGGNAPLTPVEVYVRNDKSETFHVASLLEGILHLFSNEGYRLTIIQRITLAGGESQRYAIRLRRNGDELTADIDSPYNQNAMSGGDTLAQSRILFNPVVLEPSRGEGLFGSNDILLAPDPEPAEGRITLPREITIDGT